MSSFQIGDRVIAEYKTGAYFGEVVEIMSVR